MPTNFPSGVKSRGVPVEGLGGIGSPLLTTGNVYHVDSGADAADNDNAATNPKQPAATLDGAIGKCTASNGDVILVAPGHSETISAAGAITFDVAGVTVIGMGVGNSRPTITLDTAASVDIDVTADDVQIHNMIFSMNYADIAGVFDLSAAGFVVNKCRFVDTATNMNFVELIVCSAVANECDRLEFTNNYVSSPDTGNDCIIQIAEDLDGLVFSHNYIRLGVADGESVIQVATGKDVTACEIVRNHIYRLNTSGDLLIDSDTSANTGIVAHNRIGHADTAGEVLVDADGVRQFDNLGSATNTASGYVLPAIDS
jgi:hypothetical protein|tara:strand:- start:898 stop:1839 length:942 start_codon:yes stop_codon:yes gene_type:complete